MVSNGRPPGSAPGGKAVFGVVSVSTLGVVGAAAGWGASAVGAVSVVEALPGEPAVSRS